MDSYTGRSQDFKLIHNFDVPYSQSAELAPPQIALKLPFLEKSWTVADSDITLAHLGDIGQELQDNLLAWLVSQSRELGEKYCGEWILVEDRTVVAHSLDPNELERVARDRNISDPFITRVVPDTAVWRTAYAG